MTDLVARARTWVEDVHPHSRHLTRTLEWVDELEPGATEALRLAAVLHDIERAFPDPAATWDSARHWSSSEYNRWHQDRCADMASAWVRESGGGELLAVGVDALVRVHEVGGWPEADVLQAADSLSFLDTMVPVVATWTRRGFAESARAKIESSAERIAPGLTLARELAAAGVQAALAQLDADAAERGILRAGTSAADAAAPTAEHVLAGIGLVKEGRVFRLARERFPGMPLFPGHPPFQVLAYRTPQGIRAAGDRPWGPVNDAGLGYMSELVLGSQHTGAHIDAHGHMTVGPEDRWHGGSARTDLGDFGPLTGDATEIPPLWRRGVLYDVPGFRGTDALSAGEAVGEEEVLAIEAATGVAAAAGDVALFRTGYLGAWPDAEALAGRRGAGPDVTAARLLADRGVVAVGSDTETFEVQPAPDPGEPANPQPVHTLLLIEKGVYIMESLDLEAVAAAGVREFLFVALPLAIRGATGSMIDPVAVA